MKKRFLQGIVSLGIAAAACMACGAVTASAQTLKEYIEIDYDMQQIIVSGEGGDNEILVTTAKVDKNNKAKSDAWDVYDMDEKEKQITIDMSLLDSSKDNYVQLKGDQSKDMLTLMFPQVAKDVKLKFNPYTAHVELTKPDPTKDSFEYDFRTQYSGWVRYGKADAYDLSMYMDRGTTLYFRKTTNCEDTESNGYYFKKLPGAKIYDTITLYDGTVKNGSIALPGEAYKVYSLPGKEMKVSVSKRANAPKAAVDYIKGTIKLPGKVQYRVVAGSEAFAKWSADSKTSGDKGVTLTIGDSTNPVPDQLLTAGGYLELRTAADEKTKKPASKVSHIDFEPRETLALCKAADSSLMADAVMAATIEADEHIIKGRAQNGEAEAVTLAVAKAENVTSKNTTIKKLTITNASGSKNDKIEVVTMIGTETPTDLTNGKVIANGKSQSFDIKEETKVYVRRVGDKTYGAWTTSYILMGKSSPFAG